MSGSTSPALARGHKPVGATAWFLWMVGMWGTFFVLLFADRLDGLWSAIRDPPVLVEVVA